MISKLDKLFSSYIRKRDCPNGIGRCISCGAVITQTSGDAGHYIPRAHMATRFDERNVNAQCFNCNRLKNGNLNGYKIGLIVKYGEEIINELEGLKRSTVKLSKSDILELINHYKHDNIKR